MYKTLEFLVFFYFETIQKHNIVSEFGPMFVVSGLNADSAFSDFDYVFTGFICMNFDNVYDRTDIAKFS